MFLGSALTLEWKLGSYFARRRVSWMYHVEPYVPVRKAGLVEGMRVREASRVFGLDRDSVCNILSNPYLRDSADCCCSSLDTLS